jgi:hypothetical protein
LVIASTERLRGRHFHDRCLIGVLLLVFHIRECDALGKSTTHKRVGCFSVAYSSPDALNATIQRAMQTVMNSVEIGLNRKTSEQPKRVQASAS